MKKIMLSGKRGEGLFTLVDDEDYERCKDIKFYLHKDGKKDYAASSTLRRHGGSCLLHRAILDLLPGQECDHINGDPLDNRRCNLRVANRSQNMANRIYINTSGYRGVKFYTTSKKNPYQAFCQGVYLGSFKTAKEAATIYDIAALAAHGEFAILNFPKN